MTIPFTTKLVPLGGVLLFGAQGSGSGPMQVRNLDSTNIVWVGNVSNITTDGSNSIPLNPNDTISFDGSTSIYARAATAPVIVSVMPGGASFAPGTVDITGPVTATISGPVTISGTVNVDGVAGIFPTGSNALLVNDTSHVIAGPGNYNSVVQDMLNYTSFSLTGFVFCGSQSTAGAPLTVDVEINWFADAAATEFIDSNLGGVWVANAAGSAQNFFVKGPCLGRYCQITIINPSITTSCTIQVVQLYGTGRSLNNVKWTQIPPYGFISSGLTAFTSPFVESESMPAALLTQNLPVSATQWYPFVLSNRQAWIRFQTSIALSNNPVVAVARKLINGGLGAGGTGTPYTIWNPGNTAGAEVSAYMALPTYPLYLLTHNAAVGAASISCVAITNGL